MTVVSRAAGAGAMADCGMPPIVSRTPVRRLGDLPDLCLLQAKIGDLIDAGPRPAA
jgi:hypothetical protein